MRPTGSPAAQPAPVIPCKGPTAKKRRAFLGIRSFPQNGCRVWEGPHRCIPMRQRRNGQQGTVVVTVHVSPAGTPVGVDLVRSSGYVLLDSAARDAVMRWRFLPAVKDGQPVPSDMTMGFGNGLSVLVTIVERHLFRQFQRFRAPCTRRGRARIWPSRPRKCLGVSASRLNQVVRQKRIFLDHRIHRQATTQQGRDAMDLDPAGIEHRFAIVGQRDLVLQFGQFGNSFLNLIDQIGDGDPEPAKSYLVGAGGLSPLQCLIQVRAGLRCKVFAQRSDGEQVKQIGR